MQAIHNSIRIPLMLGVTELPYFHDNFGFVDFAKQTTKIPKCRCRSYLSSKAHFIIIERPDNLYARIAILLFEQKGSFRNIYI